MEAATEVKQLVKIYKGDVRALDGVDLTVEAGKAFALLGPNGAGKTTLMRILTTQLRPTSGEAFVFGLDVSKQGSKVRQLVSYVPQEMSVWIDISGYENLLVYAKIFNVPKEKRNGIIDEVLENMGLADVKNHLAGTYSGGMVRRLEIACAMLIKPKIMFLDEPTIGLDPAARKVVWEKLTSFKKEYGVTIFFNTHYMDEADIFSDEIAIINKGKIVTEGTASELKRSVGGDTLLFSVDKHSFKPQMEEEIRSIKSVKDLRVDDSGLAVLVEDADTAISSLEGVLMNEGLSSCRVSVMKPTLDDVFLKYAGGRIDEAGSVSDAKKMRYMIRKG